MHQARRTRRSIGPAPRLLALAVGLPFVVIAVARADTTIVGSAFQSSSQASTVSQTGNNHVNPLPVIGKNHSKGTQTAVTGLADSQSIPLGADGAIIGTANQDSAQGADTTQLNVGSKTQADAATAILLNDQLIGGGGIILGSTGQANLQGDNISQTSRGSKVADNTAASLLGNSQIVGEEDGVIIGSTGQANTQGDNIAQSITQKASNPTLGNSTLTAANTAVSLLANGQGVAAGTIIGSADQSNNQGHNGTQDAGQTSAPVITGSYLPVLTDTSVAAAVNCQTVSDGSASCILLP